MNNTHHIYYPSSGEEDLYQQSCRKFATSKSSEKEWAWLTDRIQMTPRGKECLGNEFRRFFQDWYQPKEESTQAEVMVYEGDARMVIGKVLEEFAALQARFNTLAKGPDHLLNDNLSQPAPGIDPGHVLVSEEAEHHSDTGIRKKLLLVRLGTNRGT